MLKVSGCCGVKEEFAKSRGFLPISFDRLRCELEFSDAGYGFVRLPCDEMADLGVCTENIATERNLDCREFVFELPLIEDMVVSLLSLSSGEKYSWV